MKKLFVILTLLALVTRVSAQYIDFSAECETGQTLYYHILPNDNHEVVVRPPNNNTTNPWGGYTQPEGHLIIPETVEYEGVNYTVVKIDANAFLECYDVTSVVLPNSIRRIESEAFWYCTGISSEVIIPDQCTFIGGYAFMGCSGMSSLTIGASVETIQFSAFEDCIGLQSIYCKTPTPPFSEHIPSNLYYEDRSIFNNVPTDIPVYVNCLTFDQFLLNWDWSRFVNIEGVFVGTPALSVSVNNPEYGTAEVVSVPEDCDHTTATVRATPNLGHVFGYWKRNGAVVSYSPEYTFTLNHNCVMTACFDCSVTVFDSIAYPDHVIGRKYNDAGQVTDEYLSDFTYDQNGVLNHYNFPSHRYCTFSFFEYPSKPSIININLSSHPIETERFSFTYEDDHQIKHCDHRRWTDYYEDYNLHYDYYYNNHRLYLKEISRTETGEIWIVGINRYSYENGNRTRIDSTLTTAFKPTAVTTNHYNERQQILSSQTDTYDNTGTIITSRSLKTYTYTDSNKSDSIISQVENNGVWENTGIAHYIYDFKNRVIEYQTGSWSAESAEWNITKKTLYDFNDETQTVTISFRKKNNDDWVWDVFSGQSLFNNSQLSEWQRQLSASFSSYYYPVNQFEISLHYNTIEQSFPILSEWYYTLEWEDGTVTYQHLEYTSDTTINNERPKVIVRSNTQYDRDEPTEVTHEYILERNNIVYWWNKDLEEFTTLYDYAAEAGDEWEVKVGTESIMVHVDSVGVFEYQGDTRKVLHISDADDLFGGDIVVGYGHMTSFFPEKLMHRNARYTVNGLRCYWVEDALLYHNGDEDGDAIYSEIHGVEEDGPSTGSGTLTIYPNPTDGTLFVQTVHAPSLPNQTYCITNVLGQTILSGNISAENQQIDIKKLPAGMYFITVGGQTVKFVVK